jgi:hypothetical protein
MVEVIILFVIMLIRDPKLFDRNFWSGVVRIISVTGFSMMAAVIMIKLYPLGINDRGFFTLGSKLALMAGVTFAVHFGVSLLFGLEETKPVIRVFKRIVIKPVKIEY